MPRYIDAEKIKYTEYINGDVTVSKDLVEKIPTADVQEVRHGEWDEIRDAYGHLEGWIHRDCGRMSMAKENYCPNCGTKMDGGKKQ